MSNKITIIGGGPAGSTAATMLTKQGYSVDLFEREKFPRDHIGESLLPASLPILEELGVSKQVEDAGFLKKYGATMIWGSNKEPWSWYFAETNKSYPHSYQVSRPIFDKILLDNAKLHGVNVYESTNVNLINFTNGSVSSIEIEHESQKETINVEYLIDASGQHCMIGQDLQTREWDTSFQNLSVYSYYSGIQFLPYPDTNNIFIESYEGGWIWVIPLSEDIASVGIVVDSNTIQHKLADIGITSFYLAELEKSDAVKKMLSNAEITSTPKVTKDWSYKCSQLYGPNYVQVGDAACFIDPLFSSGVHMAMMGAVLGSAYINTITTEPNDYKQVGSSYQELYFKEYNHFREMAKLFYSSNLISDSYFWEARKILPEFNNYTSRHAFIRAVAGQPPHGYERAVLTKGLMPKSFTDSIQSVEQSRLDRTLFLSKLDPSKPETLQEFWELVPKLNDSVKVTTQYILGQGEFIKADTLISSSNPEGVPCSQLVKEIVGHINGKDSIRTISTNILSGYSSNRHSQILKNTYDTIHILYTDEVISEFRNPSRPKKRVFLDNMTNDGMDHLIDRN
tara:strand:+ start:6938 stop:8638 length:1701 start_codon:yes stop_codon:yes gene_type:complete